VQTSNAPNAPKYTVEKFPLDRFARFRILPRTFPERAENASIAIENRQLISGFRFDSAPFTVR